MYPLLSGSIAARRAQMAKATPRGQGHNRMQALATSRRLALIP
jgi:hypothetical protein